MHLNTEEKKGSQNTLYWSQKNALQLANLIGLEYYIIFWLTMSHHVQTGSQSHIQVHNDNKAGLQLILLQKKRGK